MAHNDISVGVDTQSSNQPEEESQQVAEEEHESPKIRASNLTGGRGQPVKQIRMATDMAISLDRFCISTRIIEQLKLETAIKLHENNKKL